jgi:hypothetical protein
MFMETGNQVPVLIAKFVLVSVCLYWSLPSHYSKAVAELPKRYFRIEWKKIIWYPFNTRNNSMGGMGIHILYISKIDPCDLGII